MLGHIGGGSAVLAAERQTLRQTQRDQDNRRGKANRCRVRQQADNESRQTHDQDGDEESVFASDDVADAPENDGAERAYQKAGSEGEQREDIARPRGIGAEELCTHNAGERPEKIEIVPFENGTERGSENDEAFVIRHAAGSSLRCSYCRHFGSLPEIVDAKLARCTELGRIELRASVHGNIAVKAVPIRLLALCTVMSG